MMTYTSLMPLKMDRLRSHPLLSMGQHDGFRETIEEYRPDFCTLSRLREAKRLHFHHASRQFQCRKYLVEYLISSCAQRELGFSCLYLATYFLDLYMDYHQINLRRLTLVAIASIMMAAKIEENVSKVPLFNEMMPLRNDEVKRYFSEVESWMLKFFNWDLRIPTAAHHVPYYMQAMLTSEELCRPGSENIIDDMCAQLESYLVTLLYDVHLMQGFSPSKVAAALIAACRIRHGFSAWNPELTRISNQCPAQFQDILERILYGSSASKSFNCMNCYDEISYH